MPASPSKEIALTCFGEASNDCDQGDDEKRAITDVMYNRAAADKKYWGGSDVLNVVKKDNQFLGYGGDEYNKAMNNTSTLDDKSCDKLKACIGAALNSDKNQTHDYNSFNKSSTKPNRNGVKICKHYFRTE